METVTWLPVDKKDAIDGVTVPSGNGGKQVNKSNLDGFCERSRTHFKRRHNIAHSIVYLGTGAGASVGVMSRL